MSEPDLDALAARAKEGDRVALEALVTGVQSSVFRLAVRFLHDREHARDATQEILVLVLTKLSTFRGESTVETWVYRIAVRHLMRARSRIRALSFATLVEEDLGQPPSEIAPEITASAEERLLEEEVFLGCTQAMLQALDRPARIAFVLGALCELDAASAARALGISEPAFRKRLSRARATLDAFLGAHCGVADARNPCRCLHQVPHNVRRGRLDPKALRYVPARPVRTSLETLRAYGEIDRVKRTLAIYQAQPAIEPPEELTQRIRALVASTRLFDA